MNRKAAEEVAKYFTEVQLTATDALIDRDLDANVEGRAGDADIDAEAGDGPVVDETSP